MLRYDRGAEDRETHPMKAKSAYFTTSDGVRLHYLQQGHGRPLVMLSGWTQPASGFSDQLADLSDAYRCVALDYRGHGESDRPAYGYRVSRLARDCQDLLNYLDLEDVVLLGHSAGCAVIWSFIDLFGDDRLRGLVLRDQPIAFVRRPEWSEADCENYGASVDANALLAQAAAIAGPDGERVLRGFLSNLFRADFIELEFEQVLEGSLKVPRDAAAALMISVMQSDFKDILPRIRRPTLCIGGEQSHIGPQAMQWIASKIPAAELVMIDARHFVHLESPGPFNSAVRDFLEQIDRGRPAVTDTT